MKDVFDGSHDSKINKNTEDLGKIDVSQVLSDLKSEMDSLRWDIEALQSSWLDESEKTAQIEDKLNKLDEIQTTYLEKLALSQQENTKIKDELESVKSSVVYKSTKYEQYKEYNEEQIKEKADIARNIENTKIEDIVQHPDFIAPQFLKDLA